MSDQGAGTSKPDTSHFDCCNVPSTSKDQAACSPLANDMRKGLTLAKSSCIPDIRPKVYGTVASSCPPDAKAKTTMQGKFSIQPDERPESFKESELSCSSNKRPEIILEAKSICSHDVRPKDSMDDKALCLPNDRSNIVVDVFGPSLRKIRAKNFVKVESFENDEENDHEVNNQQDISKFLPVKLTSKTPDEASRDPNSATTLHQDLLVAGKNDNLIQSQTPKKQAMIDSKDLVATLTGEPPDGMSSSMTEHASFSTYLVPDNAQPEMKPGPTFTSTVNVTSTTVQAKPVSVQHRDGENADRSTDLSSMDKSVVEVNHMSSSERNRLRKNKDLFRLLVWVTVAYCIGWLPFSVVFFINGVCPNHCDISRGFLVAMVGLTPINSMANIFIYIIRQQGPASPI